MKKLVKCLLASGLLVGMLAACSPQKDCSCDPTSDQPASSEAPSSSSSSSETPVPPEPQPEPKTEWTRAEELVFAQYEIEVLPFASELSIEDATDGVVLATSKEEVTTDDVDAYVALLEEQVTEDGDNCYVAINDFLIGGNTQDLGLLGFDLDASDVYQYLREFDPSLDTEYRYQNLVSVGINEDGLLQVASATVCLPLFTGFEGIVGGGMEIYPLLYDEYNIDMLNNQYRMAFGAMLNIQGLSLNFNAFPFDEAIVRPEINDSLTYAASLNPSIFYPYYLSNIYSAVYDQSEFDVFYVETSETGIVGYTQEQFDALLVEVEDSDYLVSLEEVEGKKVATYDYNGASIEVTYALSDFDEEGTIKCIELDYVVLGSETPINQEGFLGSLASTINGKYDVRYPEFSYEDDEDLGTEAYFFFGYLFEDIETIAKSVEESLDENGFFPGLKFDLENPYGPYQDSNGDTYYTYALAGENISTYGLFDGGTMLIGFFPLIFYYPDYEAGILQFESWNQTSADYAAMLKEDYVDDYLDIISIYGLDEDDTLMALYNTAVELLNDEGVTFDSADAAYYLFANTIDVTYGPQIAQMSQNLLTAISGLSESDYETSDWNNLQKYVTQLSSSLEQAQAGESTYRNVFLLYYLVSMTYSNLQTWRAKYMAQLNDAYDTAYGWDEATQSYKYDDDDFKAAALEEAMAALEAFMDVYNTEGATAVQGKAALVAALAKLGALTPDKQTLLDRLTAAFNEYAPADYSDTNWATLEGYFTAARDLIANEETSFDDAKAAYLKALEDMASVEKKASVQLAEWFAEKMVEENFKAETWTNFVDVKLPEFQARLDAAADEDEEIEIFLEATEYFEKYILNTYTQQINAFVDGLDQTQFADFTEVTSLRDAALASLAEAETEEQAQQIYDKLVADVNALRS